MRTLPSLAMAALAAIAVQPLVLLASVLAVILVDGTPESTIDASGVIPFFYFAMMTVIVATPFVAIIGVPAALLVRRCTANEGPWLALIGFAAAAIPAAWFSLGHGGPIDWRDAWPIGIFGLHGLVGAVAFHAVWRRSAKTSTHAR